MRAIDCNALPHAVPVLVTQLDHEAARRDHRAPYIFHRDQGLLDAGSQSTGIARLIRQKQIVVACVRTPPLTAQVSVRIGGKEGAIVLICFVQTKFNLRTRDGHLSAFAARIDHVWDAPGDLAPLLGRERVATVAH